MAIPAMALATNSTPGVATQTTLAAEVHDQNGRTHATLSVAVTGENGLPALGTAVISDQGRALAGVALDSKGHATATIDLVAGDHDLTATYSGDNSHLASSSEALSVHALAGTTPDFSVSVAPATLSLQQGQSGSVLASITPVNAASLTAPMFVTMSCSGIPDQTKCTFTPENLEISPNATAAVTSSMVIATQSASLVKSIAPPHSGSTPVAWAVLLPGILGLAGLAFGARRRQWLSRLSLLAILGLVTLLGTTACAPLYRYYNHGPPTNLPTPVGTYTVVVTAQSSNGITATTHTTTMALTVTQ
jgi:hypothetical protein